MGEEWGEDVVCGGEDVERWVFWMVLVSLSVWKRWISPSFRRTGTTIASLLQDSARAIILIASFLREGARVMAAFLRTEPQIVGLALYIIPGLTDNDHILLVARNTGYLCGKGIQWQ